MSVALASTWRPRGEMFRFQQLRPQLERVYASIVIATPPDVDPNEVLPMREQPGVTVVSSPKPGWGRYLAIQQALETAASHLHYADMDRLLHWIETRPAEWHQTIDAIHQTDCLILGRTEQAFRTHPQALQQTERLINVVASYLLGQTVDLGGGSRGFSRSAAQLVIVQSAPGRWGDAEWPILLHQAGFVVNYLALDGLEWESADQYRQGVADPATRRAAAEAYDQHVKSWAKRVETASEIVQEGLAAAQQSLMMNGKG
jgi:hypothetical protein